MSELTKKMCWELVTIKEDKVDLVGAAIYRKPNTEQFSLCLWRNEVVILVVKELIGSCTSIPWTKKSSEDASVLRRAMLCTRFTRREDLVLKMVNNMGHHLERRNGPTIVICWKKLHQSRI